MNEEVRVNDPATVAETRTKNRRSLVALFSIGLVPFFVAWIVFFFFPQLMPTGTTNEGDLISPPVQAAELGLGGQIGEWTLILPIAATCDEACEQRLYLARQVNTALGREAPRVHRLVLWTNGLAPAEQVLAEYPKLESMPIDAAVVAEKLGATDRIYLMDPLGNIFMVYTVDIAGKPMLKDLKHLLKISNIG